MATTVSQRAASAAARRPCRASAHRVMKRWAASKITTSRGGVVWRRRPRRFPLDHALHSDLHSRACDAHRPLVLQRLDQQVEQSRIALELLAIGPVHRHQHALELVAAGAGHRRLRAGRPIGRSHERKSPRTASLGGKVAIDVAGHSRRRARRRRWWRAPRRICGCERARPPDTRLDRIGTRGWPYVRSIHSTSPTPMSNGRTKAGAALHASVSTTPSRSRIDGTPCARQIIGERISISREAQRANSNASFPPPPGRVRQARRRRGDQLDFQIIERVDERDESARRVAFVALKRGRGRPQRWKCRAA